MRHWLKKLKSEPKGKPGEGSELDEDNMRADGLDNHHQSSSSQETSAHEVKSTNNIDHNSDSPSYAPLNVKNALTFLDQSKLSFMTDPRSTINFWIS